jgi:Calcineurin-like phosphoesterase
MRPSLRILATSDLGATVVPLPASSGEYGTCAGIAERLERERAAQPTVWLDAGDLVVGSPAHPLVGARPWDEVAELPIAAAAAGNHEFDDGLDALLAAALSLGYPLLCANIDVGLPATALLDTEAGPLGVIGLTHPQIHLSSRGLGRPTTGGCPSSRATCAATEPAGSPHCCTRAWSGGPPITGSRRDATASTRSCGRGPRTWT